MLFYRVSERRAALLKTIKDLGGKRSNISRVDFESMLPVYDSRTGIAYEPDSGWIYKPDEVVSLGEVRRHLQNVHSKLCPSGVS